MDTNAASTPAVSRPREDGAHFFVGTSGYAHKQWRSSFYPVGASLGEMLTYYAEYFSAVEIHTTMQRVPSSTTLGDWASRVSERFRFAVRAPPKLAAASRTDDGSEAMSLWLDGLRPLGRRLGAVLLPVPPKRPRLQALQEWLACLPGARRLAVAPGGRSWTADAVLDALCARNVALCITDSDDPRASMPLIATADWGYVQLRREQYTSRQLEHWAARLLEQPWRRAYVFFKHDVKGGAPQLARRLAQIFAG